MEPKDPPAFESIIILLMQKQYYCWEVCKPFWWLSLREGNAQRDFMVPLASAVCSLASIPLLLFSSDIAF